MFPIYLTLKFLLILTRTPSPPLQSTWNKPFAMPYQHSRSSSPSGIEKRIWIGYKNSIALVGEFRVYNFFLSVTREEEVTTYYSSEPLCGRQNPRSGVGREAGWLQVINITRNHTLGWQIRRVNSKFMLNKTHYFFITIYKCMWIITGRLCHVMWSTKWHNLPPQTFNVLVGLLTR
jgi:hypothetical protein